METPLHHLIEPIDPEPLPDLESWLQDDLRRLVASVEALPECGDDANARKRIADAAHDLKGLAATYGYPVFARLCARMQSLAGVPLTRPNQRDLIELHALSCLACLRGGHTGARGEPILSAVLVGLENALLAYDLSR